MYAQSVLLLGIIVDMYLCGDTIFTPKWRRPFTPAILCSICHQVLHYPSKHGGSSLERHLLAKAHIPMLNKLTESKVTKLTSSMFDEIAWAILSSQGSHGMTIVILALKFMFDI